MIEAEYKAELTDPHAVREKLREYAAVEVCSYHDTYFDDSGESLTTTDRELRLRTIRGVDGTSRHILTFKNAAVDSESGSKPEYETEVIRHDRMAQIIGQLGFRPIISFTKQCENYSFTADNRDILATLVTVPEINGTFLELETQVETESDLSPALAELRKILGALDIGQNQLTDELYTEAVVTSRMDRE